MNRVDIIESLERRTLFNALIFSNPTPFDTGNNPSGIVTADLANNGKLDVITSDFGADSVAVLRGNGDGTFQPAVFYTVGKSPESLAVGDFNADGIPDIVTVNQGADSVSVLLGIGDGTFAPAVSYAVGVRPTAVAVADVNADGHLDLVTTDTGSNSISVLLNNGDGTFGPQSSYLAGIQPTALAIGDLNTDGHPDIVTVNPSTNTVHVLQNDGLGVFTQIGSYKTALGPRSVALVDVNSDTHLDILAGDLNNQAVSVLLGLGNGTFLAATNYIAGVRPESIFVADVNGDNRPDVVTADVFDNGVAVLQRTGLGSFAPTKSFRAGSGPVAVTVADVNGDGRPDLLAADFNNNTISVLLNQTVFVPLIPTTLTQSPSQNPVEAANRLVLSAQVTQTGSAKGNPVGIVQFFSDGLLVGIGRVSSKGVAHVNVSNLSVGTHVITAHYGGDSIFAGSFAGAISQVVVPAAQATPFIEPTITAVRLPTQYLPLAHGIATVSIRDAGAGPATGSVHVQLYTSTSTTFDGTAVPLVMQNSGEVSFKLIGNQSKSFSIGFQMPADIVPGNHTIFAALAPTTGLTADQVSTVAAVGITTQQAILEFGNVNTQRGVRLARTLANGDAYTLRLIGPGRGDVTENPGGGISIALTGTDNATQLLIGSTTGVTLDGISEDAPIGSLIAPTTNLDGFAHLDFGVTRLTLADASNCELVLGGGFANFLTFHSLANVNLFSGAPIHSLSIDSFTNQPGDVITTPWIDFLTCTSDFGASLVVNGGFGPFNRGINSAVIGGAVGNSVWRVLTNVGSVQVGSIAAGWSGSIAGSIQSFIDRGDFAGQLAAHNIVLFEVDGSLTNADVLAGADFGTDGRLGNANDLFGRGILSSFKVLGNVTASVVAAGLQPNGDVLLAPGSTLLNRSAIKSISVSGSVDSSTRFLASVLPKIASISGIDVATSGNANFG